MPIAAECRLEWWEIFINTASLSIVVYAGIFFCRLPFFTWKRLGWFGVDVKRSGIFIQFLNSWTIFEKLMSRKLWRKFCEETNSVNFNSSERFTKNKTKISNFPVCITWLRFPETFMKQLNSTRRLFENSWKIKSFREENLLQTPTSLLCTARFQTHSYDSLSPLECKWNLYVFAWMTTRSARRALSRGKKFWQPRVLKKIVNRQRSFSRKYLVTWRVIEPRVAGKFIFTAAFRHKSCGRTQSLHEILFREFKLSARCRKF